MIWICGHISTKDLARRIHNSDHWRRSGWTSGGTHGERRRWVRAEWGGVWGGVSPLQPTKGSGGTSWAPPQRGPGQTDFGVFWRLQNAHFCTYMTKSWGGGQFALASPAPNSGGTCPLCPPVIIYAHDSDIWASCSICRKCIITATCLNGSGRFPNSCTACPRYVWLFWVIVLFWTIYSEISVAYRQLRMLLAASCHHREQ